MNIPDKYLAFKSREEWRGWLEKHHATDQEAWLLHSRKNVAKQFINYEEAVEEALCFGWIDGLLQPVDLKTYALRYSPRKSQSIWSVKNQQRAEKMVKEGLMTVAGLEKIAEAKENGEWESALTREDTNMIAEDLVQELKRNQAWVFFNNWPDSRKKQYLYWLNSAKRPETRQKRIQVIVKMASRRRGDSD